MDSINETGLQTFENSEFGKLEILMIDGQPYFPANEVAEMLGYVRPRKAILDHCKGVLKWDVLTAGGTQQKNFIPEGDLYRLSAHSQLTSAARFESWVFDEVLPSIRQKGYYAVKPANDDLAVVELLNKQVSLMITETRKAFARVAQLEDKARIIEKRVNDIDKIDIDGNEQQQLCKMIQMYKYKHGISYPTAWRRFTAAYNIAYNTNLMLCITNCSEDPNRKMSRPQYLMKTGRITDALRVADKMLNN